VESINVAGIIAVFTAFGPVGLIALVWYIDMRAMRKVHADHKEQITVILASYKEDAAEARRMYESNVRLVEAYDKLGGDLKDLIVLNTRCLTGLSDEIKQNQYCPMVRVKKEQVIEGVKV